MAGRNTVVRSMHDLGLAAWFGGGLMGVVGLNGGTAKAKDPSERLRLASIGWARWAPVQLAAVAAYGVGGIGLIVTNKTRLAAQPLARGSGLATILITGVAGAATVGAALAGSRILKHSDEGAPGVTEPGPDTSSELASAQEWEKWLQWSIPVLTGVLEVLNSQQGELQRPVQGWLQSAGKKASRVVGR